MSQMLGERVDIIPASPDHPWHSDIAGRAYFSTPHVARTRHTSAFLWYFAGLVWSLLVLKFSQPVLEFVETLSSCNGLLEVMCLRLQS